MNRLKGSRFYLCGSIERAKDYGHGWRDWISPLLKDIGIIPINPLRKPLQKEEEMNEYIQLRDQWRQNEELEKIANLKIIRNTDLRLVDISDALICYLNMDERPFGTIEEIVTANRSKKSCLVWVEGGLRNTPDWLTWMLPTEMLFGCKEDLLQYIYDVDKGVKNHKRWVFLNF